MKLKNGELIITELLSSTGHPIVRYTNCKDCYGRGYIGILSDINQKINSMKVGIMKAMKKVKEDYQLGEYVQCNKCRRLGADNAANLEKEIREKKLSCPS